MAFDWEGVLGDDLSPQAAYDRALDYADRMEHGRRRPESDSVTVINWLPGDGWPAPPDDGRDDGLPECDGNYPFCNHECEDCEYCRQCDGMYEQCDGHCYSCPYDRGLPDADFEPPAEQPAPADEAGPPPEQLAPDGGAKDGGEDLEAGAAAIPEPFPPLDELDEAWW